MYVCRVDVHTLELLVWCPNTCACSLPATVALLCLAGYPYIQSVSLLITLAHSAYMYICCDNIVPAAQLGHLPSTVGHTCAWRIISTNCWLLVANSNGCVRNGLF